MDAATDELPPTILTIAPPVEGATDAPNALAMPGATIVTLAERELGTRPFCVLPPPGPQMFVAILPCRRYTSNVN